VIAMTPCYRELRTFARREIGRLIGGRDLGIRDIRFTGGEHLMPADLEEIIACTRNSAPDDGQAEDDQRVHAHALARRDERASLQDEGRIMGAVKCEGWRKILIFGS